MPTIYSTIGGDYDPKHSYLVTNSPVAYKTLDHLDILYNGRFQASSPERMFVVFGFAATDSVYADFSDNTTGATLTGGSQGDVLIGGSGDDRLNGGLGSDVIHGGAGNDLIIVNGPFSSVVGGEGTDTLLIRGSVAITPDAGTVRGFERIVVADGGEVDLSNFAGSRGVLVSQSTAGGTVSITATGGSDTIAGGAGTDYLDGGARSDRIAGGAGDDVITGGSGLDYVTGGAGADRFVFASVSDFDSAGKDRILDFSGSNGDGDTIDLSRIADFLFIGDQAFSGNGAAQLRTLTYASGFRIQGDVDGDGTADFTFQVNTTDDLSQDDFFAAPSFANAIPAAFSPVSHVEAPAMTDMHIAVAVVQIVDHALLV